MIYLFESSTCFKQLCAHSQEDNCINTTSGIISLCQWPSGIPDGHWHRVIIPGVVLIQLSSWGWAHSFLKHVEDSNKDIIEETVRQVCYLPELYEYARSEKYKKNCTIYIPYYQSSSSKFQNTWTELHTLVSVYVYGYSVAVYKVAACGDTL